MELDKKALVSKLFSSPTARVALGGVAVVSTVLLVLEVLSVVAFTIKLVTHLALPIAVVAGGVWVYRQFKKSSRN